MMLFAGFFFGKFWLSTLDLTRLARVRLSTTFC